MSLANIRAALVAGVLLNACGGSALDAGPNDGAGNGGGLQGAGGDQGADGGASGSSARSCVPGQSIACAGPGGCASRQVCNDDGKSYGACDCASTTSTSSSSDGGLPDGYAPLPPPVGDQGYNAIWSAADSYLFLPLFSAPMCDVIPPYGEYYGVVFRLGFDHSSAGPAGTFPACDSNVASSTPCYAVERRIEGPGGGTDFRDVPGGTFTLTPFGADGIASGQMDTLQGIVPLTVKSCP